jgi:hypothetical protein
MSDKIIGIGIAMVLIWVAWLPGWPFWGDSQGLKKLKQEHQEKIEQDIKRCLDNKMGYELDTIIICTK